MEQVWLKDTGYAKGFLCTSPRQNATKRAYYYPQGEEASYESTKKHKECNSVGLESRCSVSTF